MVEATEKHKIIVMAILLAGACYLTYYFHVVLETGTIFTHYFYIPIILAALWWRRKGLIVAIFLAVLIIFSHIFVRTEVVTANDYFRVLMFIVIAFVVATLSEWIAKAQEMQKEAARYNRGLIESSLDPLVTFDKDGKIMDVNEAIIEATGVNREELIGTKFSEYFTDPVNAHKGVETAFREGSVRNYPLTLQHWSGRTMEVVYNASVYRDIAGKIAGVFAAARDVTERKKAEEKAAHLNAILGAIRNVNQLIVREKDRARLIQRACENLIETRGYYSAWIALVDESHRFLTAAEAGIGESFAPAVEMMKHGEFTRCGQSVLNQSSIMVVKDVAADCADCPLASTYSGRAGMAVRLEYRDRIYGILSVSIPAEMAADADEQSLFNEVAGDIAFALRDTELEEARKRAEEALRELNVELEERVKRRTAELTKANEEMKQEITERKRAEEMVLQSEEKYRTVVESINDIIFTLDRDGKFTYLSPRFEVATGYLPEDLIGHSFTEVLAPGYIESTVDSFRRGLSGETIPLYEVELLLRDGRRLPVELNVSSILDAEGQPIGRLGVARDITERKKMEDKLQRSEALYRTIFEATSVPTVILGEDGTFYRVNAEAAKISGFTKEELEGKKSWTEFIVKKEDLEMMKEIHRLRRADPDKVPRNYEFLFKDRYGNTRNIYVTAAVIPGTKRSVVSFVDLTERKRAEERIEHLNSVLKAIRDVNQVILVEKDRDSLLQKACDVLIEARGYDAAWLGFLSDGETFATVRGSGFREDIARFCEHLLGGEHPLCLKNALAQKVPFMLVDKSIQCGDCFFKNAHTDKEVAIIRVEHADRLLGLLAIALASDVAADEEEKELLKEVTGDIAFALHDLEVEEARKQAEEALKHTARSLQEHVEKLEESKKKIAEAYRLREHFLKETSHRIITPVAIIGGNTDLLLESSNLDGDQKEKIRAIQERNEEVEKLVRDALAGKYLEEEEGGEG